MLATSDDDLGLSYRSLFPFIELRLEKVSAIIMGRLHTLKLSLVLIVCLLFVPALTAQSSPNLEDGLKPYGSYQGESFATINLQNGALWVQIPMPYTYAQRGGRLKTDYLFRYGSKFWTPQYYSNLAGGFIQWTIDDHNASLQTYKNVFGYPAPNPPSGSDFFPTGGPDRYDISVSRTIMYSSYGYGQASNYTFTTRTGPHPLGSNDGVNFDTFDTSGYRMQTSGTPDMYGIQYNLSVTDRSGNRYTLPSFATFQDAMNHGLCTTTGGDDLNPEQITTCLEESDATAVTDANGNQIILPVPGLQYGYDSMGRTTQGGYPSIGGTHVGFPTATASKVLSTAFNLSGVQEAQTGFTTAQMTVQLVSSITLPNNTQWTFSYDNYGEITSIGIPTGGSITYQWQTISLPSCGIADPVSRAVSSKTVFDGTNSATWHYSWGVVQSDGSQTNVVTDPYGNDTVHIFRPIIPNQICNTYESSTLYYAGNRNTGQLLRRVDTTYSGSDGLNVLPIEVKTTLDNGLVMSVQKTYDTGIGGGPTFGNVITEKTFDYGQGALGPLLKEVDYTYLYQTNPAYATAHMADLVSSVVVYDGVHNRVAETDYGYDEVPVVSSGITVGHVTPQQAVRGSRTSETHWLNTGGSLTNHYTYFDTGMVATGADLVGNITSYTYSGTYQGAYVTQTQLPDTGSPAVHHITSAAYDFNTGLVTSSTDQNGQTTTYDVYDNMWRLRHAILPTGGGTISYVYSDTVPNPQVTFTRSITPSLSMVQVGIADGLGRLAHKQITSDPQGTVKVDTSYDLLGRVSSVTNPYRTGDTVYSTASQYDALGRTTLVTNTDSTTVSTSNTGNCVTVTDEAGKKRKTCSNGLGELTQVFEDPAGSNYETDYQYDTLGNVTCAEQHGGVAGTGCASSPANDATSPWRVRRFTYDSLSRLLTAKNPESGQLNYYYTTSGGGLCSGSGSAVCRKTDPRGITISYSYDSNARMTGKTYSNGDPAVSYGYDNGTFGIGRRTSISDGSGNSTWTYDAMGRADPNRPDGFRNIEVDRLSVQRRQLDSDYHLSERQDRHLHAHGSGTSQRSIRFFAGYQVRQCCDLLCGRRSRRRASRRE